MKKNPITTLVVSILVIAALTAYTVSDLRHDKKQDTTQPGSQMTPIATTPLDASYVVDDRTISFTQGVAQASDTEKFSFVGDPVSVDLNHDGRNDSVAFIAQQTGGSGTFYYVAAAINTNDAGDYKGTNMIFLGDRIIPQGIIVQNDTIIARFLDRKATDSFAVQPSVLKTVSFTLDPVTMRLKQGGVATASPTVSVPAAPTTPVVIQTDLTGKKWMWVETKNNGQITTPKKDVFSLTFKKDKTVSITTDCNGMGGNYTQSGNKLVFTQLISTMMFCEGSQESEFSAMINKVTNFEILSNGNLSLNFGPNAVAIFK